MKIRKRIKSMLAMLLALTMIVPENITAFAALKAPESMISGERVETYSDAESFLYFGVSEFSTEESKGIYDIPVYRGGSTDGEASVTVRTLDVAALYGKDYRLLGRDITEYKSEKTILELVASSGDEEVSVRQYEYDGATGEIERGEDLSYSEYEKSLRKDVQTLTASSYEKASSSDYEPEKASSSDYEPEKASSSVYDAENSPQEEKEVLSGTVELPAAGKSSLALQKERELGIKSRETEATLPGNLSQAILGMIADDAMLDVVYSSEQVIHFEDGEDTAYLRVEILDDDESEGPEMFSCIMADSEGAQINIDKNYLSVTIDDDEEAELSEISFSDSMYMRTGGRIPLSLTRTGALYQIASADVKFTDSATGEEKWLGTAAFAPYEEELYEEIYVPGEGIITLCNFDCAMEGEIIEAEIVESQEPALLMGSLLAANADGFEAEVTIAGKKYTLKYNKDDVTAGIFDTTYDPHLEVGRYFMCADTSHGGMFSFEKTGTNPGWTGSWSAKYENNVGNTGDYRKGNAYLYYYSAWTRDRGTAGTYIKLKDSQILAPLYQVIAPDWKQECYAYGGQRSYFDVCIDKDGNSGSSTTDYGQLYEWRSSDFDRNIDTAHGVRISGIDGKLTVRGDVRDVEKNMTPRLRMRFYGVACMYKRFRIKVAAPTELPVITGLKSDGKSYEMMNIEPAVAKIKCGAQNPAISQQEREMYVNADPDASNLVFELGMNTIYNVTHHYGTITGYRITISPDEKPEDRTVLNYPEDFFSFLDEKKDKSTNAIDYSESAVKAEKDKVLNNLQTVPFDLCFINWIEENQKKIYGTSEYSNKGFFQKLEFKPVMKSTDVKVTIEAPGYDMEGSFKDKNLKPSVTPYTYHAGDRLDLTSVPADSVNYESQGYEISKNDGPFNAVKDTDYLLLEPGVDYCVRPLLAKKRNFIEVTLKDRHVHVLNTVPAGILSDYPDLKGKTILDINPQEKNIYDRIKPQAGKVYAVSAYADNGYRPLIKEQRTGRTAAGTYYFTAKTEAADNRFEASSEAASGLKTYSVTGTLCLKAPALREDAQEHLEPVQGYTLAGSKGIGNPGEKFTESAAAISNEEGKFTLSGISAKPGDTISILVGNGTGDEQARYVTLGTDTEANAGIIELYYPVSAPAIASLTYDYTKDSSRSEGDVSKNTVRVFDDSLILNAVINNRGHKVKEVVFTLHHVDGKADGTYTAYSQEGETGTLFSCTIEDMQGTFKNGDYFTVHLVDAEGIEMLVDGKKETVPVVYPEVRTGLVMFTENKYVAPKSIEMSVPDNMHVDLPLIGKSGGNLTSGPVGLSRTNWPDGTGYTITVNLSGVITNKGSTTAKSLEKLSKYRNAAKEIGEERNAKLEAGAGGKQVSNDIRGDSLIDDLFSEDGGDEKKASSSIAEKAEESEKLMEKVNPKTEAKGNVMKEDTKFTVNVILCAEFEFVRIPDKDCSKLCAFAITAGGTATLSKSFYFVVYSVPVFLNLSGYIQLSGTGGEVLADNVKDELTGDVFDNYSGNIVELLEGGDDPLWMIDFIMKGRLTVGVGVMGILSARGFIGVGFHAQGLDMPIKSSGAQGGLAVEFFGGIGFDIFITSIEVNAIQAAYGVGTLKGETGVSFVNGLFNVGSSAKAAAPLRAPLLAAAENGTEGNVAVNDYSLGGDVSNFTREHEASDPDPAWASEYVLLEEAADRTRPEMVTLPDGRELMVFIGRRKHEGDESCLFYTVRDGDTWSVPEPVSDDSTFDSAPDLILSGDKAVVAWCDANYVIDSSEDFREKAKSFVISGAVFDAEKSCFGGEITLSADSHYSDNLYFNVSPVLTGDGDTIYCTYLARDIEKAEDITELADFQLIYSAVKGVECKIVENEFPGELGLYYLDAGEPEILYVRSDYQNDPIVADISSEIIKYQDKTFLAYGYSIDEDADLSTGDDRQVYIWVRNLTDGIDYEPIKVNKDTTGDANPKLTNIRGNVCLTWVSGGSEFHIINVNNIVTALIKTNEDNLMRAPEEVTAMVTLPHDEPEAFADVSEMIEEPKSRVMLKAAAPERREDLELSEEYELMLNERLLPESGVLIDGTISEYQVAAGGNDIYIFYTDYSKDPSETGRELFGMRYTMTTSDMFPDDPESDYIEQSFGGFDEPVQLTHFGRVLDEFDIIMNDDSVSMVSNSFTQHVDASGKMRYGSNELIYVSMLAGSVIEVSEDSIDLPRYLKPGEETELGFDIINKGLVPCEGASVTVSIEGNGDTVEIYRGTADRTLGTDDTYNIRVPFTAPAVLSGKKIVITVSDGLTKTPWVTEIPLRTGPQVDIDDAEASLNDGMITVKVKVSNTGNEDYENAVLVLENDNDEELSEISVKGKVYGKTGLSTVKAGETKEALITFAPKAEDFDCYGRIQMKAIAGGSDFRLSYGTQAPVVAEVNDGAESISIKGRKKAQLKVSAAPWSDLSGTPVFSSSDTAVCTVSADGTVNGTGNGNAVITAYYPLNGSSDTITVNVSGISKDEPRNGSSGGGVDIPAGPSGSARMTGRWQQLKDGSWTFLNSDGSSFKGWGYISYVGGFDYYHMGEDGIMDSGWFYDEASKNWYYLNEKHDGRFGAMTRGWHKDAQDGRWYYLSEKNGHMETDWKLINGVWYYLNPLAVQNTWQMDNNGIWHYLGSGRPFGSMYCDETTPDGYYVNKDGAWAAVGK